VHLNKQNVGMVSLYHESFIAFLYFLLGGSIGTVFFLQLQLVYFPPFFPSAIISACGYARGEPIEPISVIQNFLSAATLTLDCAALPPGLQTVPVLPFARAHFYLVESLSLSWRLWGVSYHSLWPFIAILYGSFSLGLYALFRSFFDRPLAIIGALIASCSPFSVSMLAIPRDFSKAPFLIGATALLIYLMKPGRNLHLVVLFFGCGCIIGVGSGFRTDVAILSVPAVLIALFFTKPNVRPMLGRAACAASLLAGLLISIAPTLNNGMSGGFGFTAIQGLTVPFGKQLGIQPASYDIGQRYSDEWSFSTIAADLRRSNPDAYDLAERGSPYDITSASSRSTEYVIEQVPNFIGDISIRALRSIWDLMSFYPSISLDTRSLDGITVVPPIVQRSTWVSTGFSLLEGTVYRPWVGYFGPPLFGILIIYLWTHHGPRRAAGIVLLLVTLLAYPSVQFSFRHFFYLEFVPWLGFLAAISLFRVKLNFMMNVRSLVISTVLSAFAVTIFIILARVQQTGALVDMLTREIANATDIGAERQEILSNQILFAVPIPEQYISLLRQEPDSFSLPGAARPPTTAIAAADRLFVGID
jgi:hypothetical protein